MSENIEGFLGDVKSTRFSTEIDSNRSPRWGGDFKDSCIINGGVLWLVQSINMVVVIRQRFVRGALAAAMMLQMSFTTNAADLLADKPIKLVGPEIEIVLDIRKKEVRINRFAVNKDLPAGRLQHQLLKPYVVRLTSIPEINPDGVTKVKASDWYDGIGLKLEIKLSIYKSGRSHGTVNITSQHEETTLFYSAQQLEVQ